MNKKITQNGVFQKMSAQESVRLASKFYAFGQRLNKLGEGYDGTRRSRRKNSQYSGKA